jgi:hypothetical protein
MELLYLFIHLFLLKYNKNKGKDANKNKKINIIHYLVRENVSQKCVGVNKLGSISLLWQGL